MPPKKKKVTNLKGAVTSKKPKAPILTDDVWNWIIEMMGAYHSKASIYRQLIDPEFEQKHGFKGYTVKTLTYNQFRTRCVKIKPSEIQQAHDKWVDDWQGIPFASRKNRVQALSDLIELLGGKEKNAEGVDMGVYYLPDVVGDIRLLIREIRNEMDAEVEREAKSASGTNIYIGKNIAGVELSPDLLRDSFIVLYKEYGIDILGLDKWPLDELVLLTQHIKRVMSTKRKEIEVEYTVVEDVHGKADKD